MKVFRDGELVLIEASTDEVGVLVNAMNEMCNAGHLEDWEFQTRMGVTRGDARALLEALVLEAPIALSEHRDHER